MTASCGCFLEQSGLMINGIFFYGAAWIRPIHKMQNFYKGCLAVVPLFCIFSEHQLNAKIFPFMMYHFIQLHEKVW